MQGHHKRDTPALVLDGFSNKLSQCISMMKQPFALRKRHSIHKTNVLMTGWDDQIGLCRSICQRSSNYATAEHTNYSNTSHHLSLNSTWHLLDIKDFQAFTVSVNQMTLSQVLKPWGILSDTDITEEHAGSIFRIIEIKECHTKPNNWVVLCNCNLYGGVYSNAQLFFCFKMLALYITEMFIKVIHFKFTKHLKQSTQFYYHLILLFLSLYGLVYHFSGIKHHNYMEKKKCCQCYK